MPEATGPPVQNGHFPSLKTLLEGADLLSYEIPLTCELRLRHAGDIEYVDESDLTSIGMSRPEQKRLRKEYQRMFPKAGLVGRIRKAFGKDESKKSDSDRAEETGQHVIPLEKITLAKELGRGEFGTVHQAYWHVGSTPKETLQVAVKCVSSEKLLANPASFLSEAAIMHRMHHDDVVRLYGVVLDTKQIMIVSELAACGSLHACLLNSSLRDSFPVHVLCNFATQIARGMAYLESQRLIHRDLAARNVLVFSASKVKISDFGLSRSLGIGEDYYRGEFSPSLRLPIAWCAPECINFLKFTHSSDVWAFGVTLWEMFSYGKMPFEGKTGAEILDLVDKEYKHLDRPRLCPEDMYSLMCECWTHDPLNRPSFAALLAQLPDRMPLPVRAVVTLSTSPTADHIAYNKDDLIYVIDKNPEECKDGSLWLGSLRNGRTGLFNPNDTVAHLGAEPPASNKGEVERKEEEKKDKEKKKKDKDSDRERLKALISQPQAVVHTAHLGIDGSNFGLLQLDKVPGSRASVSDNNLSSPASLHSSHSTSSSSNSNSVPLSSTSPSPFSPPQSRAPSQPSMPTVAAPQLFPRIAKAASVTANSTLSVVTNGRSTRESCRDPSAPPLTPELSGSDTWSGSDGATTSTSLDTVIGVPRGNGRPMPIHAVYARGTVNGGLENTTSSSSTGEDDHEVLSDQLEQLQRELTDFSLSSMTSSTISDTHPLISANDPHRHHSLHPYSFTNEKSAVRFMSAEEMDRFKEKQRKEHKKVDKELSAAKVAQPTAPPLSADPSLTREFSKERQPLESSWTPEAQEAYRLLVECGTSLRNSVSPTPSASHSPRTNGDSMTSSQSSAIAPSLPPRNAHDLPPARPPKTKKAELGPAFNYDNLNGIGAGAAVPISSKKPPPPVPPKPRVRIASPPANSVSRVDEYSPSKDDYRADFASAVQHSVLLPKKREEVLRF